MGQDRNHPAGSGADIDVATLAAAVAATRRRVADGMPLDLAALTALAEATTRRGGGPNAHMALAGLLDEVELLVGELGREHAALLRRLRALSQHRQAGSAYGHRSAGR